MERGRCWVIKASAIAQRSHRLIKRRKTEEPPQPEPLPPPEPEAKGTYYIIANNPKFDISKVAERLNEGDTVTHLNKHIWWKELRRHPIYSKCSHEIFFNLAMKGIDTYREHPSAFSKVYWATGNGSKTVPPLRHLTVRRGRNIVYQLIKEGDLEAAAKSYFNKESSAVTRILYTSPRIKRCSVGHKALRHLLRSVKPHRIKLAGFTFQGAGRHLWGAEKKFARRRKIEIIN